MDWLVVEVAPEDAAVAVERTNAPILIGRESTKLDFRCSLPINLSSPIPSVPLQSSYPLPCGPAPQNADLS